jgi:hypothetical protein
MDPSAPERSNPATSAADPSGGSPTQRYPVVFLLHDAGTMEGYARVARGAGVAVERGAMEPTIVVLPDGRVSSERCAQEPMLQAQGCHTQFLGLWRLDDTLLSYTSFLADDLRAEVRQHFRVRGADGATISDPLLYRRSHALTGVSAGGYGSLVNAFHRPDAWYGAAAVIAGVVSAFNPYSHFGPTIRPRDAVCPTPNNGASYPRRAVGLGFEDLTGLDEATGLRRSVRFREREIVNGASNCFQAVPPVQGELVRAGACLLDVACLVDPEAPRHLSKLRAVRDEHPFHGNLWFDTGVFDGGGPPAAFMDLDELLDRGGVAHSFRFLDRGALSHGGAAVSERYDGAAWIAGPSAGGCRLPEQPGGWAGAGAIWPFMSRAVEGVGNPTFNSASLSTYTDGALDPDRDGALDFDDPERPALREVRDLCPGVYDPDQGDRDSDGVGDACDPDLDGDGVPDDEDPCLLPRLAPDPLVPDRAGPSCAQDPDGDEVPDAHDRCPRAFDPAQRDTDGDGLGDACDEDDDGDGVTDGDDPCPRLGLPMSLPSARACEPSAWLAALPRVDLDGDGRACPQDCDDLAPLDDSAACQE